MSSVWRHRLNKKLWSWLEFHVREAVDKWMSKWFFFCREEFWTTLVRGDFEKQMNSWNFKADNLQSNHQAALWKRSRASGELEIEEKLMMRVLVRVCQSQIQWFWEPRKKWQNERERAIIKEHVCVWFHSDEFDNLPRAFTRFVIFHLSFSLATSKPAAHMCRVYNERIGRKDRKLPDSLRDVYGTATKSSPATDEATRNNPRFLLYRSAIHSSFNHSKEKVLAAHRCTYVAN